MKTQIHEHRLLMLCATLGVSRSAYYAWSERQESPRGKKREDAAIKEQLREIHKESKGTYGRPRLQVALRGKGIELGKHRLSRLMREQGIQGLQKKRFVVHTTQSDPRYAVAPNLLKQEAEPASANEIWVADITYVRTEEGWAYLAAVLDLYSRKIVGWSMSERIDQVLTVTALDRALGNRGAPRLHHSDRGSQYASKAYRDRLEAYGITASMSRKGNPYDNATMESFFGTLKHEEVREKVYPSFAAARSAVFGYIEAFYNTRRIHTSLGGLAPNAYEESTQKKEAAA